MTSILDPVTCWRCKHPYAWHQPLDMTDLDPIYPSQFRCYGHDPDVEGLRRGCQPDCPERDPDWVPPLKARDATQAEMNIARAWVARHRWTNPADSEAEYEHALSILVFGNARPPLKKGRMQL